MKSTKPGWSAHPGSPVGGPVGGPAGGPVGGPAGSPAGGPVGGVGPSHRAVLGAALLLGLTADLLMQSPDGPGLNLFLFFVLLVLAVGAVVRSAGRTPDREAWAWMAGGILVASGLVLRASPALQLLAFLAASAAFAFPAYRAGAAWMAGSGVSEQLEAVAGAAAHAGLGAFRVAAELFSSPDAGRGKVERSGSAAVLRGLLLAVPFLVVFGALFMSADRVFAGFVTDLFGTALEEGASHLVVAGLLAWLATGYLTGFLTGTRLRGVVEGRIRRPSLGIVESGVALGLVDLLFLAFVVVQFRYLFGGAGLVEVTPGLTYAEYAREGFGQLAFASALVLPTLLVSDWLLEERDARGRTLFRALGGVQLLLLVLVIGSAFQRVRVYQEAYGLTESRFYGTVFLGWLTLLSLWFGWTVLRGRRERFAFPALLSGYAVLAALFVANPDARIARANLARAGVALEASASGSAPADAPAGAPPTAPVDPPEGGADRAGERVPERVPGPPPVDVSYLASLGADAVPTLLRALPGLEPGARCVLARRLLERWGTERAPDWRSWNLAVERARDAVRVEAGELRRRTGPGAGCPEG